MGNLIHRGKGSFTHVENTVFFDRGLSLKAKGAYCQIRSLEGNPEWVFTVRGFVSLVRDGKDAVTAGLRELERNGYVIRARKRGEDGKFGGSEDAVWITLDDPDLYQTVVDELRRDGFSVVSRPPGREDRVARGGGSLLEEESECRKNPQVGARSGFPACGFPASGFPSCGESAPINPLENQPLMESRDPFLSVGSLECGLPANDPHVASPSDSPGGVSLGLAREGPGCDFGKEDEDDGGDAGEGGGEVGRGDGSPPSPKGPGGATGSRPDDESEEVRFDDGFEELCGMSLRAVRSLKFKRDCYREWRRLIGQGYTSEQVIDAYRRYSDSYHGRNGENLKYAKSLARWLIDDDGFAACAEDPQRCLMTHEDGSPLTMEELAPVYRRFGRLWDKARARRALVMSDVADGRREVSDDEFREALRDDVSYQLCMDACRMSYSEYLFVVDPLNEHGFREADGPPPGESLLRLAKSRDELERMRAEDPEFARLVDGYAELAAETTRGRLVGLYDDKAWETRRYEELALLRKIEGYRARKGKEGPGGPLD